MRRFIDGAIAIERIRELLNYDPQAGALKWKKCCGGLAPKVGAVAGGITPLGYRSIGIDGTRFMAHRVCWALYYGEWPTLELDHINGDPLDNRIANLREATPSQNVMNSGKKRRYKNRYRGVTFVARRNQWRARLGTRHLGWFRLEEDAHQKYLSEVSKRFRTFAIPRHPDAKNIQEAS